MFQMLRIIADDDNYMRKALAYVKKLVAKKEECPIISKEQIVADIKEAAEELKVCRHGEKETTSWEDFKKELIDEKYND